MSFRHGVAGRVYDGVVVLEDGVREPVLAEILPDVLDWVQLRRSGRQEDRRDVFGHDELAFRMPTGAIELQDGMRALRGAKQIAMPEFD